MTRNSVTFYGEGNEPCNFTAYPFDEKKLPELEGVYIVCRVPVGGDRQEDFIPIYVGQTEDFFKRFRNHDKDECFEKHLGNAICIHPEDDKKKRFNVETSLRRHYEDSDDGLPCNKQ